MYATICSRFLLVPLVLALSAWSLPASAALTASFSDGVYTVTSDADDAIVAGCLFDGVLGDVVTINGDPDLTVPPIACTAVQRFRALGGPGANVIDFSAGIIPAQYTSLTGVDVIAGPGADTVIGSFADDVIIWNPGDGTDSNDGGGGNDRIIVNGGGNADPFFIGANDPGGSFFPSLAQAGFSVLFVRDPGFSIAIRNAEILEVNGNGGDDLIDASALVAGLISLELFGGAGDDTLIGSRGADLIDGGDGDDLLIGGPGADTVFGGEGNDVLIWNPGDGTDSNDGGGGDDRIIVNGGGNADPFFIGANDPGGSFFPGLAQAGFSVLFVRDPGFSIAIRNAEILEVNGNGGDDLIDASALAAGLISLELFGGEGDDTLIGSRGADLIDGGDGDDLLIGGPGDDTILGGEGDDTNIWNNGDNTDTFDGGLGQDRQIVNGAAAGDVFNIVANGSPGSALFQRSNLVPFAVTMSNVEALEVNGRDGADQVSTVGLPGVAQFLDGGDPSTVPGDTLVVAGFLGNLATTPVVNLPGAGPITHTSFEFQGLPPQSPVQPVPVDSPLALLLLALLLLVGAAWPSLRRFSP